MVQIISVNLPVNTKFLFSIYIRWFKKWNRVLTPTHGRLKCSKNVFEKYTTLDNSDLCIGVQVALKITHTA